MAVFEKANKTEAALPETAAKTAAIPSGTAPKQKKRYDGVTTFVYIGPTLPGGKLNNCTILNGTYDEIKEFCDFSEYPDAEKLIVPVSMLAEAREKVKTPGNLMHQWYNAVLSGISEKGAR